MDQKIGRVKVDDKLLYFEEGTKFYFSAQGREEDRGLLQKRKAEDILYHSRFGHPSFGLLKLWFPSLFCRLDEATLFCETCQLAKHKRVSFIHVRVRCSFPFYCIHSDLRGPSPITGVQGHSWFVIFIDDYSRFTWVYLLKSRGEVSTAVKKFLVKNLKGLK